MSDHLYKKGENVSEQTGIPPKNPQVYEVSIQKLIHPEEFQCNECGALISASDTTEDVYKIEKLIIKDNVLYGLVIRCNQCYSTIRLIDFNIRNKEMD